MHIKIDSGVFWVGLGVKNGCFEIYFGKNMPYASFLQAITVTFDTSMAEGFIDREVVGRFSRQKFLSKYAKSNDFYFESEISKI